MAYRSPDSVFFSQKCVVVAKHPTLPVDWYNPIQYASPCSRQQRHKESASGPLASLKFCHIDTQLLYDCIFSYTIHA